MASDSAIGVFDSGVGGLTVAGAITRALPNERLVYLGDTARLPYGSKSPDVVRRYAERCADFLLTQDIKMMVIACNTATAHALHYLQMKLEIPVVGVISAGARRALVVSRSKRIGVIGTAGTIASGAYKKAIHALEPQAEVFEQACPMFVPLAEEGMTSHEATKLIARDYLKTMREHEIDALVLGCTHYPLLREVIQEAVGSQVALCDSAEACTDDVKAVLTDTRKLAEKKSGPHRFYLTDVQASFRTLAARFFGADTDPERVDL
ncbi:MAG: glutamate racemase [Deltaproteobacteria bacterium]|nr:glutamate racemase [Deltaproteobacteria bacterium]